MMPFPLFLALKYLRPKRSFVSVVTFISVLGVLLGVAILVIVLSVMNGFDNMWREKILSFKPHLTLNSRYGYVQNPEELCQKLLSIDGVVAASPAIETRVMAQHASYNEAPFLIGLDPDHAGELSSLTRHMRDGEFDLEGDSCVMGIDLARRLGVGPGDTLLVYSSLNVRHTDELFLPEELTVTGVFDMGMRDYDGEFLIASLETARRLEGMETGAQAVYMRLSDPFLFGAVADQVANEVGPSYLVRSWKDIDRVLFDALAHEKAMMFILLAFITVVAIFCVANTLIVVTVHKTNEIGLLKALGFSSGQVMMAFVWHGWIQCVVGMLGGMLVGLLVSNNLGLIVDMLAALDTEVFPKDIYGLTEIPSDISLSELIQIGGFVMISCTIASLLASARAASLDPVQALRHE